MLQITVPATEYFDESKMEFVYKKEQTLKLEHSLVSLSKWESKWHKSFFSKREKTLEETIDYIKCMTLTQNVDPGVYDRLTKENFDQIHDYIEDPMSAIVFYDNGRGSTSNETITTEHIYYWMAANQIPPEYQKWHINRLISLLRLCSAKNSPPKKMSQNEIRRRNRALNEQRKKQLNTTG